MRAPPLIRVTWLDAHQLREEAELTHADAVERAHGPLRTTTVGYRLKSDAVGVTLASEIQDQAEEPTYRGITFIPRGMVVREQGGSAKPARRRKAFNAPQPAGSTEESTAPSEDQAAKVT